MTDNNKITALADIGWERVNRSKNGYLIPFYSTYIAVVEIGHILFTDLNKNIETATTVQDKRYFKYLKDSVETKKSWLLIGYLIPFINTIFRIIVECCEPPPSASWAQKFDHDTSKETLLEVHKYHTFAISSIMNRVRPELKKDPDVIEALKTMYPDLVIDYEFEEAFNKSLEELETHLKKYVGLKRRSRVKDDPYPETTLRQYEHRMKGEQQKEVLKRVCEEQEAKWQEEIDNELLQRAKKQHISVAYEDTYEVGAYYGGWGDCSDRPGHTVSNGYKSYKYRESFWRKLCLINPKYLEHAPVALIQDEAYILSCMDRFPKSAFTIFSYAQTWLGTNQNIKNKLAEQIVKP